MRWVRDIALLLLLLAIGAGVVWYQQERGESKAKMDRTTANTQRLEREVRFRTATKETELNWRGWPVTVDPKWFDGDVPRNELVSDERPWVEIAGEEDAGLLHPPVRYTLDDRTAAFWYNPYQGVVRARVPVSVNDEEATAMYNAANGTSIPSITWVEKPMVMPSPTKPNADKAEEASGESEPVRHQQAPRPPTRQRERSVVVVKKTKPK